MSQENVDLVRRFYDSYSLEDWDGLAELCDPDFEFRGTIGGLGEGRVFRGVEGLKRLNEEDSADVWDEQRITPVRFIDGGDQVVALQHEYQRGKRSGIEVEADVAVIFEVRAGRVVFIQPYMDPAAALEAAGVSHQEAGS